MSTYNYQLRKSSPGPMRYFLQSLPADDPDCCASEYGSSDPDVARARARLILAAAKAADPQLRFELFDHRTDAVLWSQQIYFDPEGEQVLAATESGWMNMDGIGVDFCGLVIPPEILPPGVPTLPYIDFHIAAALKASSRPRPLRMEQWHHADGCGTAHCRAGWAIHLAGEEGYALERRFGPGLAGALIYAKSRPNICIPDFYASDSFARMSIDFDACLYGPRY